MKKILLIDDEPIVRACIRRMLRGVYEVVEAGSVTEATQLFSEIPDLAGIISDYHIKDGNGLAFHTWIRRRSEIPFLLISGSLPEAPMASVQFLEKPFLPAHLLTTLCKLLEEPVLASGA